jgi:hypothetical protein
MVFNQVLIRELNVNLMGIRIKKQLKECDRNILRYNEWNIIEVLCYKLEISGFDSRCHWIF